MPSRTASPRPAAHSKSTDALCKKLDLRWGIGPCRPKCMQRSCNNPKAFLAWLCWFSLLQGFVVNGINNVNTSTFERRYNLQSKQSSLISSSYDISAALFVIPFSYWGAHAHQPRLLAFAAIVMAAGSCVMSLPQWTTDIYRLGNPIADQCDPTGTNATNFCKVASSERYLSNYLYVFLLGQFLHGIGGTILYTLGIVFIDEHVRNNDSPYYQGILYACSTLGPALGYIIGGQLLSIYVDFGQVDLDTIDVTPEDPRFVGAWWIGFVSTGALLLTVFVALLPYQRELPQRQMLLQYRTSQAHHDGSEDVVSRQDFGKTAKDLPVAFKLLICNPVNMLLTCAGITEGIITSGFATFIAKFIESQYGLSAGLSAMVGGGIAVPGAAGGQFFGGLICKLGQLKVRGTLRLCMGMACCSIVLTLSCLASCSTQNVAGVMVNYMSGASRRAGQTPNLDATCNEPCLCTAHSYEPVCGSDGVQYFSSCHAGCKGNVKDPDDKKLYSDCSCVISNKTAESWEHSATLAVGASPGKCPLNCSNMFVFLPFFMFIIITTFMSSAPALNVSIRCVPDKQRSFALGVKWMFVRFLGTVPGPIIFGALFDMTCMVWQDKCGERGACWIYDNDRLSFNLFISALCFKIGSLFFFSLAHIVYRAPPKEAEPLETVEEEDDDDEMEKTQQVVKIVSTGTVNTVAANSPPGIGRHTPQSPHAHSLPTGFTHGSGMVNSPKNSNRNNVNEGSSGNKVKEQNGLVNRHAATRVGASQAFDNPQYSEKF